MDITVKLYGADGTTEITDLSNLTADTTYTISVTVAPKTDGTNAEGTANSMNGKTGSDAANINVFKPELTFKDSEVYYGDTVPAAYNNLTSTVWKHEETLSNAEGVTMIGDVPELTLGYTPDSTKIADGKINTKQDIAVDVTVKIGNTDVTTHTTFQHTNCAGKTCTVPAGEEFLLHVKTCNLTITKAGNVDENEGFIFNVTGPDNMQFTVSVKGNGTAMISGLPIGKYSVAEDTSWSWRYTASVSPASVELSSTNPSSTVTVTNTKGNSGWLGGEAYAQNVVSNTPAEPAP